MYNDSSEITEASERDCDKIFHKPTCIDEHCSFLSREASRSFANMLGDSARRQRTRAQIPCVLCTAGGVLWRSPFAWQRQRPMAPWRRRCCCACRYDVVGTTSLDPTAAPCVLSFSRLALFSTTSPTACIVDTTTVVISEDEAVSTSALGSGGASERLSKCARQEFERAFFSTPQGSFALLIGQNEEPVTAAGQCLVPQTLYQSKTLRGVTSLC